jgi:hypothetical protein
VRGKHQFSPRQNPIAMGALFLRCSMTYAPRGDMFWPHKSLSSMVAEIAGALMECLVGEICGSPIRSNGRRKLGSRSPRTR